MWNEEMIINLFFKNIKKKTSMGIINEQKRRSIEVFT